MPPHINPSALRMAKTLWSFGRSECSRVKTAFDAKRDLMCMINVTLILHYDVDNGHVSMLLLLGICISGEIVQFQGKNSSIFVLTPFTKGEVSPLKGCYRNFKNFSRREKNPSTSSKTPFLKEFCAQGSKRKVTKVVPL